MNDSRDFQDPESVRSGLCHVPSQPAFFPTFRDPGGMLSRSLGMPSRNTGPPSNLGHAWYIGKRFLQIQRRLLQHLIGKSQILGCPMCENTHHHM